MSMLDTVTVCHHCHAPLPRDSHGHLHYWSETRPGKEGWPIQVKVCRDCRNKWQHGEDDAQEGARNGNR